MSQSKPVKFDTKALFRKFEKLTDEELEFRVAQMTHEINSMRLEVQLTQAELERRKKHNK